MTRDIISVQYPKMDSSQSIADTKITKQAVTAANGITLEGAFDNKNNSPLRRVLSSFPIIEFPNGNIIKRIPKGMAIINIQTKQVNTFFLSEKDDMYIPSFVIDDKYFLSFSEQGAICVIE